MSDAHHESGSVIDLGGVALPPSDETGPVPFDYPFTHDSEVFFHGVLDGIINTGGMPRLLFVGRTGYGNHAGIAALGIAKAAAGKKVDVLVVDASFVDPSLAKPFPYQPDEGLTDMILWGASLQATLRKTENERIQIVNAGSPPAEPDSILLDHDSDSVLNTLREQAELVLVVSDLRSGAGDLSPLVGRSDRTLIVRGETDTIGPVDEALPEGKLLEITIGNLAAVEDPIDEAALQAAAAADAARDEKDDHDAPETASSTEKPGQDLSTGDQDPPASPADPPPPAKDDVPPRAKPDAEAVPAETGDEATKRAGAASPLRSSPIAPDPSVGEAIPAYYAARQKKDGSLLGLVGALAGVAAVIGVVGGIWFLQGRFQGIENSESGQPAVLARKDVPAPDERGARDANGSGIVNQPAGATGADRAGAGDATGSPSGDGAPASGEAPVSGDDGADRSTGGIGDGAPAGSDVDSDVDSDRDRSIPIQSGTKPAASISGRAYGVHVESFPTHEEAVTAAATYEAAGMPVTIKAVNVPGKGLWHRVILGRVESKSEADVLSREVKERFDLRYTLVVRVDR